MKSKHRLSLAAKLLSLPGRLVFCLANLICLLGVLSLVSLVSLMRMKYLNLMMIWLGICPCLEEDSCLKMMILIFRRIQGLGL